MTCASVSHLEALMPSKTLVRLSFRPTIVEQPETFNPDRYLDETGVFVHPGARPILRWAPFVFGRIFNKLGAVSVYCGLDKMVYISAS